MLIIVSMNSLGISEKLANRHPQPEEEQTDYPDNEAFAEGYAGTMPAIPKLTTQGLPYLPGHPRDSFPSTSSHTNEAGGTRPDHAAPLPPLDRNQ